MAADCVDGYLQISRDSVLLLLKMFYYLVEPEFENEYLREPVPSDIEIITRIYSAKGFPGCIECIDCQHWEWKNFPITWAGELKGKEKDPTIVLEAVADAELWNSPFFFDAH